MDRRDADLNERMRRLPGVDAVIAELSGAPHQVLAQRLTGERI